MARAIAVLRAFTDAQPDMTLADLSQAVRLSKSTTYRLLSALELEGLVARDPHTEAYRLGPEMIALGARAQRASDLRTASHAELAALSEATGETASLEILAGDEVLILDEVQGHHLVGSAQSIGTRWPAHATSTGKVLLAHLPADPGRPFPAGPLSRHTAKTITQPAALRRELERVREEGYAAVDEELESGFAAVAVPIHDQEARVVAAISVGGPASRLTPERRMEIVDRLRPAAARISRALGYQPSS